MAERVKAGFLPDTISSDWTDAGRAEHVVDFPNVMSKLLLLGVPLPQVIAMGDDQRRARSFPAFKGLGTLRVGAPADVAVLELREGVVRVHRQRRRQAHRQAAPVPARRRRSGGGGCSPRSAVLVLGPSEDYALRTKDQGLATIDPHAEPDPLARCCARSPKPIRKSQPPSPTNAVASRKGSSSSRPRTSSAQAILETAGSVLTNKYAEGYPGKRYYGGCEFVDVAESLAIARAKALFGADHANVQPHSGAQANMAVYFAAVKPGDTVLGMNLAHGGHLTHGHPLNFSGQLYKIVPYGVRQDTEQIDYDELERLAHEHRPKMIVVGRERLPARHRLRAHRRRGHGGRRAS